MRTMTKSRLLAPVLGLLLMSGSIAQHPILDAIANKVVQKYQQSSCEQLWERKGQPKSSKEQEPIQILRNDPEARTEFLNRVAAPIAKKCFNAG